MFVEFNFIYCEEWNIIVQKMVIQYIDLNWIWGYYYQEIVIYSFFYFDEYFYRKYKILNF